MITTKTDYKTFRSLCNSSEAAETFCAGSSFQLCLNNDANSTDALCSSDVDFERLETDSENPDDFQEIWGDALEGKHNLKII